MKYKNVYNITANLKLFIYRNLCTYKKNKQKRKTTVCIGKQIMNIPCIWWGESLHLQLK